MYPPKFATLRAERCTLYGRAKTSQQECLNSRSSARFWFRVDLFLYVYQVEYVCGGGTDTSAITLSSVILLGLSLGSVTPKSLLDAGVGPHARAELSLRGVSQCEQQYDDHDRSRDQLPGAHGISLTTIKHISDGLAKKPDDGEYSQRHQTLQNELRMCEHQYRDAGKKISQHDPGGDYSDVEEKRDRTDRSLRQFLIKHGCLLQIYYDRCVRRIISFVADGSVYELRRTISPACLPVAVMDMTKDM